MKTPLSLAISLICSLVIGLNIFTAAQAGADAFHAGPLIPDFGKIAAIDSDMPIPEGTVFKVSFDLAKQAEPGEVSRHIGSIARFLNMHVENGVDPKDLHVAIVVHGSAVKDFLNAKTYAATLDIDNANAGLVKALIDNGVEIILCGQSAAYHDVKKGDLLPGVKMALSAMTAHALLQQRDYTLNPF